MLLILDLDETLIHAATEPLGRSADFSVGEYAIYRRPGVAAFLDFALSHFETAVWTSSTMSYAADVVAAIFPDPAVLKFVWARDRCVYRRDLETGETFWIKDLKKVKRLGYSLDQVLIVDDSPEKATRNYGNFIPVRPYEGASEDIELTLLTAYLGSIALCENVRTLDKRRWRQTIMASMYVNDGGVMEILAGGPDKDVVTTRVLNAPRERVFRAWIEAEHLARWWGPHGFTNTFQEFDPRPGGHWRFVMHGPDGANYDNACVFLRIEPPGFLALEHVSPPYFHIIAGFEEVAGGKTQLTWTMRFRTAEECDKLRGFVTGKNEENLDRLEAELALMQSGPSAP